MLTLGIFLFRGRELLLFVRGVIRPIGSSLATDFEMLYRIPRIPLGSI